MMQIKKILVPTDFSRCAEPALEAGYVYAAKFSAEVVLLHVMEAPIYPAVTFAGAANVPMVHDEIAQACEDQLQQLVERAPEGGNVRWLRREGIPHREIVAAADEERADLIVIATHGYSGVTHFMMGSTAERVVRAASCPVLTVRGAMADA